jgi:hypothetical protein
MTKTTIEAHRENRLLDTKLNREEIAERASKLARLHKEKREVENEAKRAAESFKAKLKGIEYEEGVLADAVNRGAEHRDVECEWQRFDDTLEMGLVRLDTFETVEKRPQYPDERQTRLPFDRASRLTGEHENNVEGADVSETAPPWPPEPPAAKPSRSRGKAARP